MPAGKGIYGTMATPIMMGGELKPPTKNRRERRLEGDDMEEEGNRWFNGFSRGEDPPTEGQRWTHDLSKRIVCSRFILEHSRHI